MDKNNKTIKQLLKEIEILKQRNLILEKYEIENKSLKSLVESREENFRNLYENAPVMLHSIDNNGRIVSVSNKWLEIMGYEVDEVIGLKSTEFLTETSRKYAADVLSEFNKKGFVNDIPYQFVKKNGEILDVLLSAITEKDIKGNLLRSMAVLVDVSELKIIDDILRESEKKYSSIVESTPIGMHIYSLEANGKLIFIGANPAADRLLGVDNSLFIGKTIEEAFHPLANTEIPSVYREVASKGKSWQTEQIVYDDEKISGVFEVHAFQIMSGKMVVMFKDITDRKHAEAELKQSEERFKRLFESLGDAVYVTKVGGSNRGNILQVNSAAVEQTGYSKNELLKMNIIKDLTISGSGDITTDDWEKLIAEGKTVTTSEKKRRKDGTEFWTEVIVTPFDYKGEKASLSINHDITNRIIIEEKLKEAFEKATESDRLKSAFLANMSHEIRTPMNGILGFTTLLKDVNLSGGELQEYISIIEQSGDRMLNTINDLMDISKIESGQMEAVITEVNINEKTEGLYSFFKLEVENKGMRIFLKNSLPANEAIINTDSEMFYAILTNLIKNAVKYTHEGSIEFGYKKKDDFIEFYVKDTGIGIAEDRHQAIFDRFVQADIGNKRVYEGAGLGLSITKAYVEMLGGKLWLESEVGIGSVFYFSLPYSTILKEKNTKILEKAEEIPKQEFNKLKVLIAEDEDITFKHLSIILKNIAKEILRANTGLEAISLSHKNPDIDLILMDIKMPNMSGYEATRQIRQFNKDVIVIAQTAYALTGD
ncbi:PAS domain S-box protein, partial [Bacteroidota bacterium]